MRLLAIFAILVLALGIGCVQQKEILVGNDSDSHGCKGSAGYTWCEAKQKCLRVFEENCTSSKNLRIITEEFPPYNFKAPSGEISGTSTDIVRELLKRTNMTADIELMSWSDGYAIATSGPYAMLYSVGRTPSRENLFKWVGPIGVWKPTLYANAASNLTIASPEDASKAGKICVVKEDLRHNLLRDLNFTNIEAVAEDGICARMLSQGEVSLWMGSATSFKGIIAKENLSEADFKPMYDVFNNPLYLAFSKDVPDSVVSEWQQDLADM
jgi:ABC-type amino acid transport substrate-binding protein